jgi:hypothetical protein
MAWEVRDGNSYYYYSRKVSGRVVHVYVGRGEEAERFAAEATRRRLDREARRAEQARLDDADGPARQFAGLTDLLTHSAFLAAGFYRDHGRWRPRPASPEDHHEPV